MCGPSRAGTAFDLWREDGIVRDEAMKHSRAGGVRYGHGWLPAVVPAHARRFRVIDQELAASLADVGADLVETAPDVEIAPFAAELRGDATLAVITIDPRTPTGGRLAVRASRRLATSLRTRARVAVARRTLRRAGYEEVSILFWDAAHRAQLPGMPPVRRRIVERLPGRALAIGRRGAPTPSMLDEALKAVAGDTDLELRPEWASIRSGIVMVAADGVLLRMTLGRARIQIVSHVAALEALRRSEAPPSVGERLPWLLAHGRVGIADWSLERLLPGVSPPRTLTPGLLDECVDFLIGLHGIRGGEQRAARIADLADVVAGVCQPENGIVLSALAEHLEYELRGVARGFGHGDFFSGNLLAEGDRLTGVLDWDAAGPDRLPLLDLLHLHLTRSSYGGDEDWGRAVVERLLPLAQAGGDAVIRRYCRAIGLDAERRLLEALVLAYWLEYVAYQLRTHGDRRLQPAWIEGNVALVLRDVAPLLGKR